MSLLLPQIRVGQAVRYQGLAVFPLFWETGSVVAYKLAEEGLGAGTVAVAEVNQEGSVPELLVENKGNVRVLFLEGEQLVGAKQNRILNTSLLVPAQAKIKIPVSCVEQGRWHYTSLQFDSGHPITGSSLRSALKSSVTESVRSKRGHRSNQVEVWRQVQKQQETLSVSSSTSALLDTHANYADQLAEYRARLGYVAASSGLAAAIGGRVVALDLFDKPETCRKVWSRLLSAYTLDALESGSLDNQVEKPSVDLLWCQAGTAAWEEAEAVGEGQEFRAEFPGGQGSVLVLNDTVIHLNLLACPN